MNKMREKLLRAVEAGCAGAGAALGVLGLAYFLWAAQAPGGLLGLWYSVVALACWAGLAALAWAGQAAAEERRRQEEENRLIYDSLLLQATELDARNERRACILKEADAWYAECTAALEADRRKKSRARRKEAADE